MPYNGAAQGFRCGLLVRRKLSYAEDLTFSLTHAPEGTGLADLGRVAGMHWTSSAVTRAASSCLRDEAKFLNVLR